MSHIRAESTDLEAMHETYLLAGRKSGRAAKLPQLPAGWFDEATVL